jgi:WD40 repeat protein
MDFEIEPLAEFFIGEGVGIKSMIDSGSLVSEFTVGSRFFVILDTLGRFQVITFSLFVTEDGSNNGKSIVLRDAVLALINRQQELRTEESSEFLVDDNYCVGKRIFNQFHSGEITGIDTCPIDHLVATSSTDGSVRCFDYIRKREVASKQFDHPVTCLRWLPPSLDPSGRTIIAGFADGTVRVLGLAEGNDSKDRIVFIRKMVCKPHNSAVVDLSFNGSGTILATTGKDGIVFFLRCLSPSGNELRVYWPLKFVTIGTLPSGGVLPGMKAPRAKCRNF